MIDKRSEIEEAGEIDLPGEQAESIELSLDRFREQSFFTDECLDLLVAVREDPDQQAVFDRFGYQEEWLDDILHQRRVLEQMSTLLLNWETVRESRDRTGVLEPGRRDT